MAIIKTITSQQKTTLQQFVDQKKYPDAYRYVRDIIKADKEADQRIANWLDTAGHVNANDGTFYSDYVRAATMEAGENEGTPITSAQFQHASDRLAETVLRGIVDRGGVSDINTIISQDVKAAVTDLGLNMEGWAGTSAAVLPTWAGGLGLELDGEFYQTLFQDFNRRGIDKWYERAGVVTVLADNSVTGFLDAIGVNDVYNQVITAFDGITDAVNDARSEGDPHLLTLKYKNERRIGFDLQEPGEYYLVETTDGLRVQARQEPMPDSKRFAVNTAVAMGLGNTTAGLYVLPQITGWVQGTSGDDRLEGEPATTHILGAQDNGEVRVTTGITVTLVNYDAGASNSLGYGERNEAGEPTKGRIIFANGRGTALGSTFTYETNSTRGSFLFLIPGGYNRNPRLIDGYPVTFKKINNAWAVCDTDGNSLASITSTDNPPVYALYSDTSLNRDGKQYHLVDGDTQRWEDLPNGDKDFNDVVVKSATNSEKVVIMGGDTLISGQTPTTFGYVIGSDGVDSIKNFDPDKDKIIFYQKKMNGTVNLQDIDGGTLITITPANGGKPGFIWQAGVSADKVRPCINFDNMTVIPRSNFYIGNEEVAINPGEWQLVGNDGLVYREGDEYRVVTRDNDGFIATLREDHKDHIDIRPFVSADRPLNSVGGLLGGNGGLTRKDGTVLGGTVRDSDLYGTYADGWSVTPNDTQFIYWPGKNTSSYKNPAFGKHYVTPEDFSADVVAQARSQVIAAGCNDTANLGCQNLMLDALAGMNITEQTTGMNFTDYLAAYKDADALQVISTSEEGTRTRNQFDEAVTFMHENDKALMGGGAGILVALALLFNRNRVIGTIRGAFGWGKVPGGEPVGDAPGEVIDMEMGGTDQPERDKDKQVNVSEPKHDGKVVQRTPDKVMTI